MTLIELKKKQQKNPTKTKTKKENKIKQNKKTCYYIWLVNLARSIYQNANKQTKNCFYLLSTN